MADNKIVASKENVREALARLDDWPDSAPAGGDMGEESKEFVKSVLEACERKLPSQAAYEKEKQRKSVYHAKLKQKAAKSSYNGPDPILGVNQSLATVLNQER